MGGPFQWTKKYFGGTKLCSLRMAHKYSEIYGDIHGEHSPGKPFLPLVWTTHGNIPHNHSLQIVCVQTFTAVTACGMEVCVPQLFNLWGMLISSIRFDSAFVLNLKQSHEFLLKGKCGCFKAFNQSSWESTSSHKKKSLELQQVGICFQFPGEDL